MAQRVDVDVQDVGRGFPGSVEEDLDNQDEVGAATGVRAPVEGARSLRSTRPRSRAAAGGCGAEWPASVSHATGQLTLREPGVPGLGESDRCSAGRRPRATRCRDGGACEVARCEPPCARMPGSPGAGATSASPAPLATIARAAGGDSGGRRAPPGSRARDKVAASPAGGSSATASASRPPELQHEALEAHQRRLRRGAPGPASTRYEMAADAEARALTVDLDRPEQWRPPRGTGAPRRAPQRIMVECRRRGRGETEVHRRRRRRVSTQSGSRRARTGQRDGDAGARRGVPGGPSAAAASSPRPQAEQGTEAPPQGRRPARASVTARRVRRAGGAAVARRRVRRPAAANPSRAGSGLAPVGLGDDRGRRVGRRSWRSSRPETPGRPRQGARGAAHCRRRARLAVCRVRSRNRAPPGPRCRRARRQGQQLGHEGRRRARLSARRAGAGIEPGARAVSATRSSMAARWRRTYRTEGSL